VQEYHIQPRPPTYDGNLRSVAYEPVASRGVGRKFTMQAKSRHQDHHARFETSR
jgi:hypothetical protein